ncbi:MAG: hypothetical protein K0R26_2590 [Bacteroidota bacterium]|jgi:hypothetical protein|nr:hypothetical protein [Bacteroidota bacterium]
MQFISNFPWYYTLLCLVAGFVFSGLLYYRDKQNAERTAYLVYGLFVLRLVSVSLIALLLLDIFIKRLVNETEKPVIILAQDNSTSIVSGKDSLYIRSTYNQELAALIDAIKEKYEVRTYQFDSEPKPSNSFNYTGKETDIAKLFSDIENNYANKNIGAIILSTDGIYNKGANPLYSTDKLNAPIFTIALGDTAPLKDIWIQSINHNQVAYLGNVFPAEVNVNAIDLKGKEVQVSLSHKGKILKSETVTINSNSFNKTLNFLLDASDAGVQKYTVSVSQLSEDKNKQNNTQSFVIDVIDNREKILILANAPHPDIAALEQSISSAQTYEVEVAALSEFTKPLKPYSLVIIHQGNSLPQRISNELKANNQSVFYIGGSPLNAGSSKGIFNSKSNEVEGVYQKEFSLFTISEELKNFIKDFPAVITPFKTNTQQMGTQTLISQKVGMVETEDPLWAFSEINGIKTGIFSGDGLWRWRMRDYQDHNNHNLFNELISKTVQYLSVKADKSFFRVFSKKIINENESLDFTAEVYNQSYELVTEPDVTLVIRDSKNKTFNYTFSKKQTLYSLSAGQFPPGEYSFEAQVKYGDQLYTKKGTITVKEIVSERVNTVANHHLLYQLASQSGGKLFYKNELTRLQQEILSNDSFKSITYSHRQLTDLVNLKWIFFIILAFLSVEWFLRKYNGRV